MISRVFRRTISRYGLIATGDRVLVAFSGGQDSSVLLDLLLNLRDETPIEIVVAHFNHKLRPSANDDAAFAAETARKHGLPFVSGARDVRRYARKHKLNIEEAARELRYAFLRSAARRAGAGKIATGHTLTDQAETMLMRLLRGTGPLGLAGISPRPDGTLVRPLIDISRRDIEAYARRRGIPYRLDETNMDRRYLRNRIRLDLLPGIEAIEPAAVRHLGRLAGLLRDEEELLDMVTGTAWSELARRRGGRLSLDAAALEGLPAALARRVVRKFLSEIGGGLRGVTFDDVETVRALRDGKEKTVRAGLVLKREAGSLFPRPRRTGRAGGFEIAWDPADEIALPRGMGKYRASFMSAADFRGLSPDDRTRVYLDASGLEFPLFIRSRRPGDRYRPMGAPGSKKLKEILRAKKIPLSRRDRLPVFLSGEEILWVPGLPVAEGRKVGPSTGSVLMIRKA
jgi:tRNA(Ile)-lysidine synthase